MSPYLSPKKAIAPRRGGFVLGRLERPRRCVGQRLVVGDPFDLGDLGVGDRVVVAEVEAQPVGSDQRAGLLDVLAQHLAQRVVQHVRAGVVAADRGAAGDVDRGGHRDAGLQGASRDPRRVASQAGEGERGVEHLGLAAFGPDRAGVADLTAALGVERGAVEEQLDGPVVVGHDGQQARFGRVVGVSEELGDAELLDDLAVGVEAVVVGRVALARRLGPLALRLHLGIETGDVDGDVALAGDLFGQLQREPVGVVQQERGRTRQLGAIAAQLVFEDRQAVLQRLAEALFLAGQHADDEVAVLGDVGVGVAHDVDGGLDQRRHHQLLGAEQVRVAHGATDDASQHVAAALVRREHAVADQHGAAASVLGEHPHGERCRDRRSRRVCTSFRSGCRPDR